MRDIKFRAWDYHKKEMSKPFSLGGYPEFANERTVSYWSRGMCSIMQFTGLKDKNGKEIYEGDIVKTVNGFLRVIVWEGGAFHSRVPNWEPKKDMPTHPIHFWNANNDYLPTVIGNIYEHSHLLKDGKQQESESNI